MVILSVKILWMLGFSIFATCGWFYRRNSWQKCRVRSKSERVPQILFLLVLLKFLLPYHYLHLCLYLHFVDFLAYLHLLCHLLPVVFLEAKTMLLLVHQIPIRKIRKLKSVLQQHSFQETVNLMNTF